MKKILNLCFILLLVPAIVCWGANGSFLDSASKAKEEGKASDIKNEGKDDQGSENSQGKTGESDDEKSKGNQGNGKNDATASSSSSTEKNVPPGQANTNEGGAGGSDTRNPDSNGVSGTIGNQGNDKNVGNAGGGKAAGKDDEKKEGSNNPGGNAGGNSSLGGNGNDSSKPSNPPAGGNDGTGKPGAGAIGTTPPATASSTTSPGAVTTSKPATKPVTPQPAYYPPTVITRTITTTTVFYPPQINWVYYPANYPSYGWYPLPGYIWSGFWDITGFIFGFGFRDPRLSWSTGFGCSLYPWYSGYWSSFSWYQIVRGSFWGDFTMDRWYRLIVGLGHLQMGFPMTYYPAFADCLRFGLSARGIYGYQWGSLPWGLSYGSAWNFFRVGFVGGYLKFFAYPTRIFGIWEPYSFRNWYATRTFGGVYGNWGWERARVLWNYRYPVSSVYQVVRQTTIVVVSKVTQFCNQVRTTIMKTTTVVRTVSSVLFGRSSLFASSFWGSWNVWGRARLLSPAYYSRVFAPRTYLPFYPSSLPRYDAWYKTGIGLYGWKFSWRPVLRLPVVKVVTRVTTVTKTVVQTCSNICSKAVTTIKTTATTVVMKTRVVVAPPRINFGWSVWPKVRAFPVPLYRRVLVSRLVLPLLVYPVPTFNYWYSARPAGLLWSVGWNSRVIAAPGSLIRSSCGVYAKTCTRGLTPIFAKASPVGTWGWSRGNFW